MGANDRQSKGSGSIDRRAFLRTAGVMTAAGGMLSHLSGCDDAGAEPGDWSQHAPGDWASVRDAFIIDRDYIHMAGMLLTPHPRPVREAIQRHRDGLDRNPTNYLSEHNKPLRRRAREAAADYIGGNFEDVGLTDSTTMGIGIIYNGIAVREGQEMLTTDHDYFETHHALEFKAARTGATIRKIPLYQDVRYTTTDELVDNVIAAITPQTRLLAATWVHSKTGLKLPVRQIADRLESINAERSPEDRVLFCLDGVHGFGVEDVDVPALGCDFFFAGTHKWIFAPRGTGIVWGRPEVQEHVTPTIPTFVRDDTWGGDLSPGGFQAFEHQWSMPEAFDFHQGIGRKAVTERIHALSRQLKEGLRSIDGVTLVTPMEQSLSAGIVCFEVDGKTPHEIVAALAEQRVIGSVTPYEPPYARLSPGLLNTEGEIDWIIGAVREMT